ncbi:PR domain zinc finger protein 4 [Folsomia candida]|uniref:PR domain zinc finger protein 4 n=2 Tax=Folsomia candida TaxID=158441 RepID=A0A226DUD7_FOLCA|nr:PR domain zinc finger protein 4 [Folsomia candida]
MLRLSAFLNFLTQYYYLELVNFAEISPEFSHLPILRTHIINYKTANKSFQGSTLRKIRIYNSTQVINLDFSKFSNNFLDALNSQNFRNNPTFRIFVYLNDNLTLNNNTLAPTGTNYNLIILLKVSTDSDQVLQTFQILNDLKWIELCRAEKCRNFDIILKNINYELKPKIVPASIPSYTGIPASFYFSAAGNLNSAFNELCSDSAETYHDIPHLFVTLPPEVCLLLGFMQKTNVTVQLMEKINDENTSGFIKLVKLDDSAPIPRSISIYPYAESRDALEYAVFVNKSSMVLNLMFLKPFDNFVWTTFFLAAISVSFLLCYSIQKGWSYLGTSMVWTIGIFLGQSNNRFESQVKRHVGGLLIGTWSLMMIILSNCYTDLFYAVLVAGIRPDVAPNLAGILNQAGIRVYSFKNHHQSLGIGLLVGKVSALRDTDVKVIRVPDLASFEDTVHSLAYFGRVRGQKISSKFLLLQSSNDLDRFSALMKITGRFVHVKNADFHLVGTRSAWISSGNWVGRGLRRVLPGYSESGIYSVWARKWDTLLKRSGQYFLRGKIQKLKGHGDDGGQKALSWGQLDDMEVIDPAIELLEEVEFLTQIVSRSRQRICKIARRSGVNVQQDQINGAKVAKLLSLLDSIVSLKFSLELQNNFDPDDDDGDLGDDEVKGEPCPSSPNCEDNDDQFDLDDQPESGAYRMDTPPSQVPNSEPTKAWECSICLKTFRTKTHLKSYVVTHDSDAKVKCEICGNISKNPITFSRHVRTVHSQERPSCGICHGVFASPDTLRKHISTVHSTQKRPRFPCEFPGCERTYLGKYNLNRHVDMDHSGPISVYLLWKGI